MTIALTQFRTELYESLPYRADALMDLIDALSSNTTARSAIELSLNPLFRRQHSSLPDAIDNWFQAKASEDVVAERWSRQLMLARLMGPYLPEPTGRPFWLLGIDVTPVPRPFAQTLADRTFIYHAQFGQRGQTGEYRASGFRGGLSARRKAYPMRPGSCRC